jgi:putative transposase
VHKKVRRRRPVRLNGYDYSQAGAYFVTVCVNGSACLLGEVEDGRMCLNGHGRTVYGCWEDLPHHYAHVRTDAFVVMPNHVHGIVMLDVPEDAGSVGLASIGADVKPKRHGLPEIVRAFKSFSARRINESRKTPGGRIWQRGYYERVVRNDEELNRIREYIVDNPAKWSEDVYHPSNVGPRR